MAFFQRAVFCSLMILLQGAMAVQHLIPQLTAESETLSRKAEALYSKALAKRNNTVMYAFAKFLLGQMGGKVASVNEPQLNGVLPFYSGLIDSRGYGQLVRELSDATWVDWSEVKPSFKETITAIQMEETDRRYDLLKFSAQKQVAPGALADLDEVGYHAVAELRSDAQMEIFARRILATHGGKAKNSDDLHGMVPFYSGVSATQSFENLVNELQKAPWVVGFSATPLDVASPTAPLNQEGYAKVLETKDPAEMELFIRRVVAARDATVKDEGTMSKQVKMYCSAGKSSPSTYDTLVTELLGAKWLLNFNAVDARKRYNQHVKTTDLARSRASGLNEQGFEAVASIRNNGEMGNFIRKVLASRGCKVVDRAAFVAWLPTVSGTKAKTTYPDLLKDLQRQLFVSCESS